MGIQICIDYELKKQMIDAHSVPGVAYPITLGSSLNDSDPPSDTFFTMRLDFIPASVDKEALGTLTIDEINHQASLRVPNGNATVDFHGSWEPSEDAIALFDPLTGSYRLELISSQASLRHAPGPTRERQADKGPSPMKRRKKAGQPPAQTNDESGKDLERLKRPPTEEAAVLE